jgi:putative membrane protein
MKRIGILSVTFAAMLAIACGDGRRDEANKPAGDTPAVGTAGERSAADRDREVGPLVRNWIEDRVEGGTKEVKLGELASQKAQNADVKAFGRMMVQDHTKANDELKQFISKHSINVNPELDNDAIERFSKMDAGEFDRDYINQMVDDHESTVKALEDRLDKEGTDENPSYTPKKNDNPVEMELNQWAAKAIPTVRKHLEKAKELDQKLGRRTTENRSSHRRGALRASHARFPF